jgi:thiol-disulfide isomerase/thioredoxin
MHRYFIIILLSLGTFSGLRAQKPVVEVIYFPQLEEWFQADNDTLYVINFWATWCRPCVAEMPYFDQLQQEMVDQKVKVQFVSMDFISDLEKKLIPFLKRKKPFSSVYLLDEPKYNKWMGKVSEEWSGSIPATIFVQHSRDVREFHEGEFTYEELKTKVESLTQ